MEDHDHSMLEPEPRPSFWQSRTGITLIFFLVTAAILLSYEHRVHIFGGNSGTALFVIAWIGLHFFMHRGHGGHGAHGGQGGHGGHSGHGGQSDPQGQVSSDPGQDKGDKP